MPEIVKSDYQALSVSFTEDGWFNATIAADHFGKRVDHWLGNQETKEYLAALCDLSNTRKEGYLKTRRGNNGGTWMHPRLAIPFARWLDVRFGVWCDDQIYKILTGSHPRCDWKRLRHEATASYKVMGQILQMTRQRLGKTCAPHHFSNEARLINWALTGEFGKLDREELSPGDLDLLAKLENLDSVLRVWKTIITNQQVKLFPFSQSSQRASNKINKLQGVFRRL